MQLSRVSMASLADDPSVFVKGMMQTLVATVRASHMLPSNEEEFEYQVLRGQGARPRARSSLALAQRPQHASSPEVTLAQAACEAMFQPPRALR